MIDFIDLHTIAYPEAYEQQKTLFEAALQDKKENRNVSNTILLCEHPHVITLGKNGLLSNLLFSEEALNKQGVELFHTDRGGDITYHGPGQLVAYPILDLDFFKLGLKEYIWLLEEIVIQTIAQYGIQGERLNGATGVWLDTDKPKQTRKIAAIGVRSSRFVTMHGFALNVNTDLHYFQLINPCGFIDKGVTSMEKELGKSVDLEAVKQLSIQLFRRTFDSTLNNLRLEKE